MLDRRAHTLVTALTLVAFTALTLPACRSMDTGPSPPTEARPAEQDGETVDLLDPRYPPAGPQAEGWDYRQATGADLNQDGTEERIVVMAAVSRNPDPNHHDDPFIWDDGQPWQVYIEAPDGERTYVYSQFVQLGTLEVMVGGHAPEDRSIVIQQTTGADLSIYQVFYEGPQEVQTVRPMSIEVHDRTRPIHRGE